MRREDGSVEVVPTPISHYEKNMREGREVKAQDLPKIREAYEEGKVVSQYTIENKPKGGTEDDVGKRITKYEKDGWVAEAHRSNGDSQPGFEEELNLVNPPCMEAPKTWDCSRVGEWLEEVGFLAKQWLLSGF